MWTGREMDFTVWKDVCIGSLYAVFVSVFILWLCRRFGAKQNLERVVEPAQDGDIVRDESTLEQKHKVFLSHSGAQKDFVEQLCVDLERYDRYPFFDRRRSSLPIGRKFPKLIFEAIEQCEVGVVVLSEEFFTMSKWPMLELVAMTKNEKLVIMPVFLGLSLEQYRDPMRQKGWVSIWLGWVREEKRRGREIDIEEWCGALRALDPLNSLIYDGGSKVSFRESIVRAVCDVVLPEARWKDSHVHGRSRLSKVVCEKIDEAKVSQKYGVPVVGLYGVGGIGKTTICQTLCNVYLRRMQGRVFHVELGGASDMELLQGALKRLTDKSHEFVCGLEKSQCEELLIREMQKQPIFLVIDNMFETTEFIKQAKYFLSARFSKGSIVVVTARSFDVLKLGLLDIDEHNILEMPELLEGEAKSLFMEHAICGDEVGLEIDEGIIARCLERCYFEKGDGKSYHYHPLALKVLGTQLGCSKYDRNKWAVTLKDLDIFNGLRDKNHPIFSILRKSFDILRPEDQMLFMDVALFLPEHDWNFDMDMTWFDWLSMVHSTSVDDIMDGLESLKRKSLLQELGDGRSTKIGMHDLWYEFAEMESKLGKFEGRRWVYEVGLQSALEEGSPSRGLWQNMKRMCFMGKGLDSAKSINFDYFSNITVMKMGDSLFEGLMQHFMRIQGLIRPCVLRMDMQKLKHLKSIEFFGVDVEFVGLGLVENLCFLRLRSVALSEAVVDDIGHLTNLRVLVLVAIKGERLPNVSKLISLEEVHFSCSLVTTISGFSSRLSKLRILNLFGCWALRSLDPGVGDLVALHELRLEGCYELEELPNLQKLSSLQTLEIQYCNQIKSVRGLDNFVIGSLSQLKSVKCRDLPLLTNLPDLRYFPQLEKLSLGGCAEQVQLECSGPQCSIELTCCRGLKEIPDLSNFSKLRILRLENCDNVLDFPCSGALNSLETIKLTCCRGLKAIPDLSNFLELRILQLENCDSVMDFPCSGALNSLETIKLTCCRGLKAIPDLSNFLELRILQLENCDSVMDFPCSGALNSLETIKLTCCHGLKTIPDLSNFPELRILQLENCDSVMDFPCSGALNSLETIKLTCCRGLKTIPDLSNFPELRILQLENCDSVMDFPCSGALNSLETIKLTCCRGLKAIPDLSNFSELRILQLRNCESVMELTCTGALTSLKSIELTCCRGLKAIPNLSNFPQLGSLRVSSCGSLLGVTCTGDSSALEELMLGGCRSMHVISDLCNFSRLKTLLLSGCESLTDLACLGPAAALEELDLGGCQSLNAIPDLVRFPHLKKLCLRGCDSLQDLTCSGPLPTLTDLSLFDCLGLKVVPDLGNFPGLSSLYLIGCESLREMTCSAPSTALHTFYLSGCLSLRSMPNLSKYPCLVILHLICCESLGTLPCSAPLTALEELVLSACFSLDAMPDLCNFPQLTTLWVSGCKRLVELMCTEPVAALNRFVIRGCDSLKEVPDLSSFPQLKVLEVTGSESLTELVCSGLMVSLEELNLGGCWSLRAVADVSNFPRLQLEKFTPQEA